MTRGARPDAGGGSTATWFNPTAPGFRQDPYPAYRRLRAEGRVHRSGLGFWALSHYADVQAAQRDARLLFVAPQVERALGRLGESRRLAASSLAPLLEQWRHMVDPVHHERFRGVVARALSARSVQALQARVRVTARRVAASLDGSTPFDVVSDYAEKLPIEAMCELLGLPEGDRDRYRAWSISASRLFDGDVSAQAALALGSAVADCRTRLTGLIGSRRLQPAGDLLSMLVQPRADCPAGDDEVVAYVCIILAASYETSVNLVANGILALLTHPGQLELLRADRGLLPRAVEELARFDTPVQLHSRWTREAVSIGAVTIPAGERVLLLIGSANRDPERFERADELDLRRDARGLLSFGGGARYCLGAPLARAVAEEAIDALLDRFPSIGRLVEPPAWQPGPLPLRALEACRVDPAGALTARTARHRPLPS